MKNFYFIYALVLVSLLSGCAAGTTWILMPDESGKVGAITLTTANEFKVINKAYHPVTLKEGDSRLSSDPALSETQVDHNYASLIKAQPSPALSFTLYFNTGSTKLIEKSQAILPHIVDQIKAKLPTDVTIIGHTDTTGSDTLNDSLALKRAKVIEQFLRERISAKRGMHVESFGSKGLLVPTPPDVNEPKNRAVDILVL